MTVQSKIGATEGPIRTSTMLTSTSGSRREYILATHDVGGTTSNAPSRRILTQQQCPQYLEYVHRVHARTQPKFASGVAVAADHRSFVIREQSDRNDDRVLVRTLLAVDSRDCYFTGSKRMPLAFCGYSAGGSASCNFREMPGHKSRRMDVTDRERRPRA
jgi:hypothetical protein